MEIYTRPRADLSFGGFLEGSENIFKRKKIRESYAPATAIRVHGVDPDDPRTAGCLEASLALVSKTMEVQVRLSSIGKDHGAR